MKLNSFTPKRENKRFYPKDGAHTPKCPHCSIIGGAHYCNKVQKEPHGRCFQLRDK